MRYKKALKTALWGLAGFIISLPAMSASLPVIKWTFGYILFTLSVLMFILACSQLYKDNAK